VQRALEEVDSIRQDSLVPAARIFPVVAIWVAVMREAVIVNFRMGSI
jgi:hypothetical protein